MDAATAVAVIGHHLRMRPCNRDDPITLDPLSPKDHIIFRRVQPSGAVVAYIAPVLTRYFLTRRDTASFRDPYTNTPMNRCELWRLDREMLRAGCLMPSVLAHYDRLRDGEASAGNRDAVENEVATLEALMSESLRSMFDYARLAWSIGFGPGCALEPREDLEQLVQAYDLFRILDEPRARASLTAMLENETRDDEATPYTYRIHARLACICESCHDLEGMGACPSSDVDEPIGVRLDDAEYLDISRSFSIEFVLGEDADRLRTESG